MNGTKSVSKNSKQIKKQKTQNGHTKAGAKTTGTKITKTVTVWTNQKDYF